VSEDVFKPEASWTDLKGSNHATSNGTLSNGHTGNGVVSNGAKHNATTGEGAVINSVMNGAYTNGGSIDNEAQAKAISNDSAVNNGVESEAITNDDAVNNGVESEAITNGATISNGVESKAITNGATISNGVESESITNGATTNGATITNGVVSNGTTTDKFHKRVDSKLDVETTNEATSDEQDLQEIRRVLTLLNDWTFTHPQVLKASPYQLKETKHEMKMWILGHLIQAEDSVRLARQKSYMPFETPTSNFYNWVTHVSADHTSVSHSRYPPLDFLALSRTDCLT
jgi:hypothetical protein